MTQMIRHSSYSSIRENVEIVASLGISKFNLSSKGNKKGREKLLSLIEFLARLSSSLNLIVFNYSEKTEMIPGI
jgi:hypothetical protein